MSGRSLSRWFRRIVDRSLDKFSTTSSIAHCARQQFIHQLRQDARYADPKRLARSEHQVYSQGGEDGILREIFRRIGETDRFFVELGVGDGLENNTAFLLTQGWKGVWLDGSAKHCAAIRARYAREIREGRLTLLESLATSNNIGALIKNHLPSTAFDLLSLDLDRNTYYIWQALHFLRPRVAVVEYNALYPADFKWVVDYDEQKGWNGSTYFGASLKAIEELGASLGYSLVGCDIAGVNAFFVRSDLCGDFFAAPFSAENHYEPVRYFLHGRVGHPRAFSD